MKTIETDVLVIGSGIAGISYALQCSEFARVVVITKSRLEESNTRYAQGGIAAVFSQTDSPEDHFRDTMTAGCGINDPDAVRFVVNHAREAVVRLHSLGVGFDRSADGSFDLHLEGGHSHHRIVHTRDETGKAVETALVQQLRIHPKIHVYEMHFAVELMVENNTCCGAMIWDINASEFVLFKAVITMLANGGSGQVYSQNTNSEIATGDGIGMAFRAGVDLSDLEFVQFHPTVLYAPVADTLLITEALRGAGAELKNREGRLLMTHHPLGSLAPRDIVSRAIFNEMQHSGEPCVYLDARSIESKKLKSDFPHIYQTCLDAGIDITRDMIPVVPAAHYMCGGITVDLNAVSSLNHLLASGEVSRTGLHGANRLASNSLLEAVVFAESAATFTKSEFAKKFTIPEIKIPKSIIISGKPDRAFIQKNREIIRSTMWDCTGIIRTEDGLKKCLQILENIQDKIKIRFVTEGFSVELKELENMALTSWLITNAALKRKESIGCHFRLN